MANESQTLTSTKKPWYKTWWGILILIVFWPVSLTIFLIHLIWNKTKWNSAIKIAATAAVLVVAVVGLTSFAPSSNSVSPSETATQEDAQAEYKKVFDVPSLVGKNIDEVIGVLGPAREEVEMTDVQKDLFTTWNKTWDKDGASLLVTYNPKTGEITDFFITTAEDVALTSDQQLLLTLGGVEQGRPEYDVEFVTWLEDPSKYTGVKIIPVDQEARAALIEERKNFDDKRGSDAFSARHASDIVQIAADNGIVMDAYIEAGAPDAANESYLQGGSESDFVSQVSTVTLNAVVDSSVWALTPDSTKKDFVASLLTNLEQTYPNAFPHVQVSNGIRMVAEGSFSVWSGDKIELK